METKNELYRNAIMRQRRKEMEMYQQTMDMKWLDSRMEDGRMGRCMALIQREAEMEKNYQERTDHAAIVNSRAKKELALGMEVAKVRREESSQLLRRHYLRERDPSLRQLITKLTAGYVCRDLRQQILHNEYRRLQEKAEEQRANSLLSNSLFNNLEADARAAAALAEQRRAHGRQLQAQLVHRDLQRQCTYEDTLVEKKMLEGLMRTLADEDQREVAQKRMLKERTRREMDTFRQAQDAWKEKQKTMVINEEREIAEQKKMQSDRSTAILEARARVLREKDELNQRITDKLLADEEKRQERVNIIKALQEQEYLEKNVNDNIAESQAVERKKREVNEALTAQMTTRRRLADEQKLREADYRKETEKKLKEEELKEQEKKRKSALRAKQYAAALQQQINDNFARKQAEKLCEKQRAMDVQAANKAWSDEVEAERATVISEHAAPLVGYLQPGLLRPADLQPGLLRPADLPARPPRHTRPKCNEQCRVIREY